MSKAKTTKQFTNATFESKANRLLCANLRFKFNANYLLIRFWVIDFICLLNSRDLDCFALPLARTRNDGVADSHLIRGLSRAKALAMTKWWILP